MAKFKVGDKVMRSYGDYKHKNVTFYHGEIGTVEQIGGVVKNEVSSGVHVRCKDGLSVGNSESSLILMEDKPIRKFKTGDIVRIIQRKPGNNSGFHDYRLMNGDVGKVVKVGSISNQGKYSLSPVKGSDLEMKNSSYLGVFDEDDIEFAPHQVEISPKFKVGDRVRIKSVEQLKNHYRVGNFETIFEITYEGKYRMESDRGTNKVFSEYQLELIEESPQTIITNASSFYINAVDEDMVVPNNYIGNLTIDSSIFQKYYTQSYSDHSVNTTINKPNKKQTTMSKITTFIKNVALSADEKIMRKHGLKDEDGQVTYDAQQAILTNLFNSADSQAYLLTIAKGLEADAKKDCK